MHLLGHLEGRANIAVAIQQESWNLNPRKHIAEVVLGEPGAKQSSLPGRVDLGQDGSHLVDKLSRCRVAEQGRDELPRKLIGWSIEEPEHALLALFCNFRGERARPARVGRRENERPGILGYQR